MGCDRTKGHEETKFGGRDIPFITGKRGRLITLQPAVDARPRLVLTALASRILDRADEPVFAHTVLEARIVPHDTIKPPAASPTWPTRIKKMVRWLSFYKTAESSELSRIRIAYRLDAGIFYRTAVKAIDAKLFYYYQLEV